MIKKEHEPVWSAADWRRLLCLGHDTLLSAGLHKALAGDVECFANLMDLIAEGQAPELVGSQLLHDGMRLTVELKSKTGFSSKTDIETITLMQIVAMALSTDPSVGHSSPSWGLDKLLMMHSPARRDWGEGDDRLVRSALRAWRSDHKAIEELFVAGSRFAPHAGFVQAFIEEGIDLSSKPGCRQRRRIAGNDHHADWCALELMLRAGNLGGAALWLSTLDLEKQPPREVSLLVDCMLRMHLISEPERMDEAIRRALGDHLCNGAEAEAPRAVGVVHRGALALLAQLSRVEGVQPWILGASMLNGYLKRNDQSNLVPDARFTQSLLEFSHNGSVTLSRVLAGCDSEPLRAGAEAAEILEQLLVNTAMYHCVELLDAARPSIVARPHVHARMLKACALAADPETSITRDAKLAPERFAAALESLAAAGLSTRCGFFDEWGDPPLRTTLLHVLADSRHDDVCEALMVLLHHGCDPSRRDGRRRMASSLVPDHGIKEKWKNLQLSFVARECAQQALAETAAPQARPR